MIYEYKKISGVFGTGIDEGVLNACGRDGWRLVTAVVVQPIYIQKPPPATEPARIIEGYNEYIFVKEIED